MLEVVQSSLSPEINFVNWGLLSYEDALNEQLEFVRKVYSGELPDTYIFCSHFPVVTKGRATQSQDIFGWNGDTVEVQRGGRATYHGPSQLVIYPIVNLQNQLPNGTVKMTGIREFLSFLENSVVQVLKKHGIIATGRCGQKISLNDTELEATGVWTNSRKICSLGIGVKRWVTYHGLALNIDYDPKAFIGLNPCGFNANTMISMEEILGEKISRSQLISDFQSSFSAAAVEAKVLPSCVGISKINSVPTPT